MVLPPFEEYVFFSSHLKQSQGYEDVSGLTATKLPPNEEKPLQTCGGKKVREFFPPKMHFILWLVVSMMFYFHPYLGKSSNLTNIFSNGLVQPPTSSGDFFMVRQ